MLGLLASAGVARAQSAAPANDNFASAQTLNSDANGAAAATADSTAATREPNEPGHWSNANDKSVWYRWTAPSDGSVVIDTQGSNFDTVLAAYTGSSLGSLHLVASNDDAGSLQSRVRFAVTRGTTYSIAVASYGSSGGSVKVQLAFGAGPANDAFASARNLGQGTQTSVTGNTAAATREPSEPRVGSSYGDSSVWYSWTAPSTGAATIDTAGSSFNTVLGVYTGDGVGALSSVASNDDVGSLRTSRATFRAQAGTTYRIQVEGYSSYEAGAFNLNVSLGPLPTNDLFALATPLPGNGTVAVDGSNVGAGVDIGEPNPFSYDPAHASVWYSWTAPRTGSLTIRTTADFQSVITAYTGDSITALNRVATQTQQAFNGGAEQVRIRVQAGETYRIQIDGRYGATGGFGLSLNLLDTPANDDFSDAISLASELNLSVAGSNVNATQQVGEPVHDDNYCDPSVWYSWTAPVSGGLTLDTAGSEIRTVVGVYTGGDLASLTRVPTSRVTTGSFSDQRFLRVEAGVTYRIAVDGLCGAMGNFRLAFSLSPPPLNDMFALAQPLLGNTLTASGDLTGASGEAGEPNPGGSAGASVWYSWRAPGAGVATLSATGSTFTPGTRVYTGDGLLSLASVPLDNSGGFKVEAGATYRIAVHGNSKPDRGRFNVALSYTGAPDNDDFVNSQTLDGNAATAAGDLRGASGEPGEPNPGGGAGATVWYSWRAPASGTAVARASASSFTPGVRAYTGDTLASLTSVSVDGSGAFRAEAGQLYRIAVNGGTWPSRGSFSLSLGVHDPPANDDFANAQSLEGEDVTAPGDLSAATYEAGEPNPGGGAGTSVWYSWRAPSSGETTMRTTGGGYVQPYTGDALTGLTALYSANGAFKTEAGRLYRIAVHGGGSYPFRGSFTLTLHHAVAPANDDFQAAEELTGTSATARGTTLASTLESGEYFDGSGRSVWYSWTAPTSGTTTVDLTPESNNLVTSGVYTGTGIAQRTLLTQDHHGAGGGASRLTFHATAGTTYRIAIGACGDPGAFRLGLAESEDPPRNDPPAADPPANDPPSDDPPADDPPAGDQPSGDQPSNDAPAAGPPLRPGTQQQQAAFPNYWWTAPQAPSSVPSAGPSPLTLQAAFPKTQRVRDVLRKGFRGAAACSRDCSLQVTAELGGAAGATRAPKARATLKAPAGAGKGFVVRLPKAVQRKLGRARSPSLTLRLVARSGSQTSSLTRRVPLRR